MAKTYDFKNTRVVVGGFLMEGYAKGSSIKVGRYEDAFTMTVGADGQTTRSRNANRSGFIQVTLQQASPSNAVLSALATADELSSGLPVPVIFIDGNAQPLTPGTAISKAGWVKKKADSEFAGEQTDRTWVIDMEDVDYLLGAYA